MSYSYSILDVNSTTTTLYFEQMLSLYLNPAYRSSLLEGYVSASGAGSDALLQASRSALVSFVEIFSIAQLIEFCTCLNNIIRTNIERSIDRVVIPTLVVYGFLFDAGVFERVQGQDDWWVSFFLEGPAFDPLIHCCFRKLVGTLCPYTKKPLQIDQHAQVGSRCQTLHGSRTNAFCATQGHK